MNRLVHQLSLWMLAATATLLFSGCSGYQLGAVKPSVYQNIHRIHVPTFENETLEPRASVLTTNAVIKQLQQDGTYTISSKETADAVLKATITDIERKQLRAAETDTLRTTEMKFFMVVSWSLVDPDTGAKLAYSEGEDLNEANIDTTSNLRNRPGRVIGQTILFRDPNFQLSERNALPLAAEDAAKQLVSQIAHGW